MSSCSQQSKNSLSLCEFAFHKSAFFRLNYWKLYYSAWISNALFLSTLFHLSLSSRSFGWVDFSIEMQNTFILLAAAPSAFAHISPIWMAVGVALLNGRWVGDNVINSVGVAVVFVGLPKNYRPKRRNAQRTPPTNFRRRQLDICNTIQCHGWGWS